MTGDRRHRDAVRLLAALATDVDGTRRPGALAVPYRVAGRDGIVPRFASPDVDVEDVAARCVLLAAAGADQYLGVQLLRAIPARGRGGAADTAGLSALAVDIDVEGDGHAATNDTGLPLPPSQEAAAGILAGLPDPTYLVATGGGVHAWWIFNRHAAVDLADAKRIVRGWSDLVRGRAHDLGWHVDQTGDLARVLRLPGTINHKYPDRPAVEIVGSGPRHSLDELAALIPVAEPKPERPPAVIRPASGGTDAADITAHFSADTDWSTLLEPPGWRCCRDNGHGERHWTRPGKTSGTSAVSHDDPPVVHVFTNGATLPVGTLTKLDVLAHLQYGGDVRAAWHAIAPPLDWSVPDVGRLARWVAKPAPAGRVVTRLRYAVRQIGAAPGRDAHLRALIAAAATGGLPLDVAARVGLSALQTIEVAR